MVDRSPHPSAPLTRYKASRGKSMPILCHHLLWRKHPRFETSKRIFLPHVTLTRNYERTSKSLIIGHLRPDRMLKHRVQGNGRWFLATLTHHSLIPIVEFGRPHHHGKSISRSRLWRTLVLPDPPEVARWRRVLLQMRSFERLPQILSILNLFQR